MPPKAKGKAKAGAAAALASEVGVKKFTRIKHGDLQHEADVKRSFSVPGSYGARRAPTMKRISCLQPRSSRLL